MARLGVQGDGIVETADGPVFAPLVLPGEHVRGAAVGERMETVERLSAAPQRVDPACPHFGPCGGCSLQHFEAAAQTAWKRDMVVTALAHRGFDTPPVGPVLSVPADRRRRVTVTWQAKGGGGAQLGFLARRSHRFVPVRTCPVLAPAIAGAWAGLEALAGAATALSDTGQIHVLASDTGLDIDLRPQTGERDALPGLVVSQTLLKAAQGLKAARLCMDGQTMAEWRRPTVTMGRVPVAPPPGAFLQPSAEGQAHLTQAVRDGVGAAGAVADLFAGCGTFALALAPDHPVHAVEQDEAALNALDAARRHAQGLKPVSLDRRDLFQRPLSPKELARFEAVVMDPPRSGAREQAAAVAASDITRVVMVSCNPATFARDARILADGGFTLATVHPVDQFVWSTHIESVAVMHRV
ncbi:MAG: class I SAM-dependent RNA methyltransferase [Alphaproteobacteria bacterium]